MWLLADAATQHEQVQFPWAHPPGNQMNPNPPGLSVRKDGRQFGELLHHPDVGPMIDSGVLGHDERDTLLDAASRVDHHRLEMGGYQRWYTYCIMVN
jgi:hypothetical protein